MRRPSSVLRAIKKYSHCNVRKSFVVMIIFAMFLLLKDVFIRVPIVVNNDVSIKDNNLFQFQSNDDYYSNDIFNSTTVASKGSSFFMSLSYFEQLTCATRNLLSAGNVAQNLGAKVVIPFLLRSRLYGIPDLLPDKEVPDVFFPLHTVYDIAQLNMTFHFLSNTYLVDFENFLYNAPREITMVDFIHTRVAPKELSLSPRSIAQINHLMNFYSHNIFDCTLLVRRQKQPLLEKIKLMLRISTRRLGVEEFVIRKYICINPSADVTSDELKKLIGPELHTVVFTQWRGCAYHSCDITAPRNISSSFRSRFLYHSNHTKSKPHVKDVALPLSGTIKATAVQYLQKINLSSPFISVHIRIEKLSRVNDRINGHSTCCLGILHSLLKSLKWKYFNRTLLITDIAEYGSDACYDKVCLPHSRKVKGILNTMGLTQHSFNPDIVGSSKSPAFASLVEMHMLAMGDRLVVMGQGSFKHQIITNFLNSNPTNKLYHICTEDKNILNEFSKLNRDCWKDNG